MAVASDVARRHVFDAVRDTIKIIGCDRESLQQRDELHQAGMSRTSPV